MDGKIQNVRYCRVISIDDETGSDRIKVRLSPEDNDKSNEELAYAFPLLPKMIHVKPKVGEGVFIFLAVSNVGDSQRYYIGPVISQDHRIYSDPFFMGGDSFFRGGPKELDESPERNKKQIGIFPEDNDVMIRGRKNADIQITDDDIRIRAGVKVVNVNNKYDMTFNPKNPAYIKAKYHEKSLADGSNSTMSVVADKILLLSNTSQGNNYSLTNQHDLITDSELKNIIESAYKLHYGEKLVEFLKAFVKAFMLHTHPFMMKPPIYENMATLISKKAELLDNKKMLSDTVRIN